NFHVTGVQTCALPISGRGAGGSIPGDACRAGARALPGRCVRTGAACMSNGLAVDRTELPFPLVARGKVRDIYDVGDDRLLLVATDRISAFDVVMEEPIPHKGAVLTQITAWWLARLGDLTPNHLITA